jgi:hypothetical protein
MNSDKPSSGIRRSDFLRGVASVGLAAGLAGKATSAAAQDAPPTSPTGTSPKPATQATRDINALYRQGLPFNDTHDFEDARRGLLAALPDPVVIRNDQGVPVWDATNYGFIKVTENDDAPDTVNPSLWRMAKLNMIHGLFEVVDGIWQVRGYDLSVMSIIRSNTGYIVIDPLISQEVSAAVWQQLVAPKLGDKPVVAVIHTQPCRSLRRRANLREAGRHCRGQGQDPRAGGFHARRGRGECYRRQRNESSRELYVRQPGWKERYWPGRRWSGQDDVHGNHRSGGAH